MQLVRPIDIENALRVDLAQFLDADVFAPPAPDDISAGSVQVMSVGGAPQSAVSNEHDVRVDCWAATPADAIALANEAAGIVASLPLRDMDSGRHYLTASLNALPYLNPDPNRPLLPRASFRAELGIRGIPII